jgi:hypothetical protein
MKVTKGKVWMAVALCAVPIARLSHVLADGTLVIPFDSPEQFHWWNGRQEVKETSAEAGRART